MFDKTVQLRRPSNTVAKRTSNFTNSNGPSKGSEDGRLGLKTFRILGGVHAGKDKDGATLYVGRAHHEGDLLPAKVSYTHGGAYVAWGGKEYFKDHYQVLVSEHAAWEYASGGNVPAEAIVIGHTSDGEKLYMGRALHEGTLTPGKVHPSHGCLYIPYNGQEVRYDEYEVLVLV